MDTYPNSFPLTNTHFLLSSPSGNIEVATTVAKQNNLNKVIIICHPHPLYGGTMDNKVVTTIMRTFNEMGFKTVRFNFRGVGQSEGEHNNGVAETEDLLSVLNWTKSVLPDNELWLAGFSFGSYVAYRIASLIEQKTEDKKQNCDRIKLKQLILIAPPVHYPEFIELIEPDIPCLIIQGEQDEIVDADAVSKWAASFAKSPQLIRMPETSHFFHGKLIALKNNLQQVFS